MFTRFICNFQAINTRRETLEGKSYLVVPSVMMTPGVRAGSEGPILYRPEQLSKTPSVWNHKPVTLYHPMLDGKPGASACDPAIIEKQKIGLIMNTVYDNKLKNECWLDDTKMQGIVEGTAVLNAINEGKMIEVSTGLWVDQEGAPGVYEGTPYKAEAMNIRPDHLAILVNQIGACSIADGAGLLRNAEGDTSYDDIREQLKNLLRTPGNYAYIQDVFPKYAVYENGDGKYYRVNYKISKGKVTIPPTSQAEEVRRMISYVNNGLIVVANDSTEAMPSSAEFATAVQDKYAGVEKDGDWNDWSTEIDPKNAVFSKDGNYFRLPYTYSDSKVAFDETAKMEPVQKVTEYRSKDTTTIDANISPPPTITGNNMSDKKTLIQNQIVSGAASIAQLGSKSTIDQLIATGRAQEADRSMLEVLPAEQLSVISMMQPKAAAAPAAVPTPVLPAAPPAVPAVPMGVAGVPAPAAPLPAFNQAMTMEQFMQFAPPEVQSLVNNAKAQEAAMRTRCVSIINNRNPNLNPAWLGTLSTDVLKGMAAVAMGTPQQQTPVQNYGGQASVPMFLNTEPTTNNAAGDAAIYNAMDQEILSLPSMTG